MPSVSVKRREASTLAVAAPAVAVKVRTPPLTAAVESAMVVVKLRIAAQLRGPLVSWPQARK